MQVREDDDQEREAQALLAILARGRRQVEEGKVMTAAQAFERLRQQQGDCFGQKHQEPIEY